jgi:hypothetical protein
MQKRSRVWQAVIFGFGFGVLGGLTLPEMAAASPVRIWSFSPKASILRNGVSKPARYQMVLEAEDLVKPEIGEVLEVICSDKQIRTVQSGAYSGLSTICPSSSANRINTNTFESRGNNCSSLPPIVLAPTSDKLITTTADYPTFLFFVPTTTARQLRFSIRERDQDRKSIYRQTFRLSGQSGILRVVLPNETNSQKLAVGQSYKWEFNIVCDPENRGIDDFLVGELKRVALVDANVPSQLTLWERYRAFEYDALMLLDLLRRTNPSNQQIQAEWKSWLVRHNFGDLKGFPAIELK